MARNAKKEPSTRRRVAKGVIGSQTAGTPPVSNQNTPNVTYTRSEVPVMNEKWQQVKDCLGGAKSVKAKGELYLPAPLNDPDPTERAERYKQYLLRAQFFNFTSKTLQGMQGQVFSRDPLLRGPDYLKRLAKDISGAGATLDQQAKEALGKVLAYGRCGIFADYPARSAPATAKEIQELKVRPSIQIYSPWSIINWREVVRDGRKILTLVVIQTQAQTADDGFQITYVDEWRVLSLDAAGEYVCETWRRDQDQVAYSYAKTKPLDADGNPFNEIPFSFIGSLNNESTVDEPPLYDLSEINLGHYRNSADYEEACFTVGQPTLFITGLTQDWVKNVFDGYVYMGSRAAIPGPVNSKADLLQVKENTMAFEAMKHKEAQAIAFGAMLIQDRSGNKTFGESQTDQMNNSSYLATCAKNVSAAYTKILPYLLAFTQGAALRAATEDLDNTVMYDLNTDFPAARMTPNERTQLVAEWQDGAISWTEMRDGLRKAGVATQDNEKAKAEIEENPPPKQVAAEQAAQLEKTKLDQNRQPQPLSNAPSGGNQDGN